MFIQRKLNPTMVRIFEKFHFFSCIFFHLNIFSFFHFFIFSFFRFFIFSFFLAFSLPLSPVLLHEFLFICMSSFGMIYVSLSIHLILFFFLLFYSCLPLPLSLLPSLFPTCLPISFPLMPLFLHLRLFLLFLPLSFLLSFFLSLFLLSFLLNYPFFLPSLLLPLFPLLSSFSFLLFPSSSLSGDYHTVKSDISKRIARENSENSRLMKAAKAKKDQANVFANKVC